MTYAELQTAKTRHGLAPQLKFNTPAALQEIKDACEHYAAKIEHVPGTNKFLVFLRADSNTCLPMFANFDIVSASISKHQKLSHDSTPTDFLVGCYIPKQGKFKI